MFKTQLIYKCQPNLKSKSWTETRKIYPQYKENIDSKIMSGRLVLESVCPCSFFPKVSPRSREDEGLAEGAERDVTKMI